jgi:hypothetical protein
MGSNVESGAAKPTGSPLCLRQIDRTAQAHVRELQVDKSGATPRPVKGQLQCIGKTLLRLEDQTQ